MKISRMEENQGFGAANYAVFGVTLLISTIIGLYYRFSGGKQKTSEEYIHGNQSMGPIPVAFSLMASFMSAITLLGVSNENYSYGTQFIIINFSYIVGTPICAYIFLPVFFRCRNNSAYAYLERRFGKFIRTAASLSFSFQTIMYMSIVLYAPAIALSAATGVSYLGSMLAVGICCTIYSTLGGIKAVLITDVFQSILMFGSVIAVIVMGAIEIGGVKKIFQIAEEGGRIELFNMSLDPRVRHTFWTQFVGGMFTSVSINAVNQAQVQRLLTIGNLKKAQASLWIYWAILLSLGLTTAFAGLTMYAYYLGCDPIKSGRITKPDQLLAIFAIDTMSNYPGLTGLFVAGIFSGSLSTVSSSINSLAAVTLEDYLKPLVKIPSKREPLILKILAFSFGVLCVLLAFLSNAMKGGILQASLTVFGVVGGPVLGLFSLGMLTHKGNQIGASIGFLSSIIFLLWIGFGQPKPPIPSLPLSIDKCPNSTISHGNQTIISEAEIDYFYLYEISYAWYAFIGFFWSFGLGYIVSYFTVKYYPETPNPELLVQWKSSSSVHKGQNNL